MGGACREGRLALVATQSARRGAVASSGRSPGKKRTTQDDKALLGMTKIMRKYGEKKTVGEGMQGTGGVGGIVFYGAGGRAGDVGVEAARGVAGVRRAGGSWRQDSAGAGEVHDLSAARDRIQLEHDGA